MKVIPEESLAIAVALFILWIEMGTIQKSKNIEKSEKKNIKKYYFITRTLSNL